MESLLVVDPPALRADGQADRAVQPTVGDSSYLLLLSFLQEDMQQLILMPLPNVAILGQDPLTGRR